MRLNNRSQCNDEPELIVRTFASLVAQANRNRTMLNDMTKDSNNESTDSRDEVFTLEELGLGAGRGRGGRSDREEC